MDFKKKNSATNEHEYSRMTARKWQTRERGDLTLEMSYKLQFVAGLRHSLTAESHDKLKFVGHYSLPAVSKMTIKPKRKFVNIRVIRG